MVTHPLVDMAFFFYLKAFNCNISMMIQSLWGITLLGAYDLAIQAKNNFIDAGKLPPRPPMLVFTKLIS